MVYEFISYTPEVIYGSLMGGLAIGSMALGGIKSIFGGIQAISGGRQAKRLGKNAPQYDVKPPEYFQDLLSI